MDYSEPGSSVYGILQARILMWVAISSSKGSSWPRDRIRISCVSCSGRQILYHLGSPKIPQDKNAKKKKHHGHNGKQCIWRECSLLEPAPAVLGELTAKPSGILLKQPLWKISFSGDSVVKNPCANAGDSGSIPGSGRSPGEGNGNPLQYTCLENPMDGGARQATVHGIAKESDMT